MKSLCAVTVVVLILCASVSTIAADNVSVIDGDTIKIDGRTIRLWGIDAPELYQTCEREGKPFQCGEIAREVLKSFIQNDTPQCTKKATDRYKRTVAQCTVDGVDLGSAMVNLGWALDYEHYSKGFYAFEQGKAQAKKRGLWNAKFTTPWGWRKDHRRSKH